MTEQTTTPQAKQQLPNVSIVTGCFILGLILGIIGLAISAKDKRMYEEDPKEYTGYGSLNAGRILSIIGIVLGGLIILYWIIWVLIIGGAALTFLRDMNFA